VVIEGVKCENTVINCHNGLVAMVGDCRYIYRNKTIGIDTVDVFIRKGGKLHRIGEQVIEIKPRPLPQVNISGLRGGVIQKGALQVQQGVRAEFYVAGNHWESCKVDRFDFLILRGSSLVVSTRNEGNLFSSDTKAALQQVQPGDKVIITNIKGCLDRGGGDLKTIEFIIE
jgi:hypothetical protein